MAKEWKNNQSECGLIFFPASELHLDLFMLLIMILRNLLK